MSVLIAGSRDYSNFMSVRNYIYTLSLDTVIITGGCRGADKLAENIAKNRGMEVKVYIANWKKYGKGAGPIRNLQMIKEGKPDKVVIFHPDIENSKGSKNMKELAEKHNLPVTIFKN